MKEQLNLNNYGEQAMNENQIFKSGSYIRNEFYFFPKIYLELIPI